MSEAGYIQDYPCRCSGGEMCFIIHHPAISPPPSYETREEAESDLQKIRSGELTQSMLYPNLRDEDDGQV